MVGCMGSFKPSVESDFWKYIAVIPEDLCPYYLKRPTQKMKDKQKEEDNKYIRVFCKVRNKTQPLEP